MKTIYELGWPVDPFKQLSADEMAELLKSIELQKREEVGEALW